MIDRETIRADFLRQLPSAVEALVQACYGLPHVEEGGAEDRPVTEYMFFKKEEAVVRVQELRAERQAKIKKIEQEIEKIRNTSTEPRWATEDDQDAGSDRFDAYCRDKWAKEKDIKGQIRELEDGQIAAIQVEIQLIDEFLAKAAEKRFPRTPHNEYGRKPGEKVNYDPRAWRDEKVRRFLGGS